MFSHFWPPLVHFIMETVRVRLNLFEKHKPKNSKQSKEKKTKKPDQNMGVGPIGSIWFQRRRLNIKVYRQWRWWQTQSYDSTSHDPLGKKWAKKPSTI